MSKIYYVYSKLANDQRYNTFKEGGADLKLLESSVLIRGKAGLANKNLITPQGVVTSITEAELDRLKNNPVFNAHKDNGFIIVSEQSASADDVAESSLTPNDDPSAPLTPDKYVKGNEFAPSGEATPTKTATTKRGK